MRKDRSPRLDLLALAEDVADDRRTLSNVIDQIAVAEPDDEARRQAVSELQSLVVTLTAIRRRARATAESRLGTPAAPVVSGTLVVDPMSVQRRAHRSPGSRPGLPRFIIGTGMVLLAVAIVAAIATWMRSSPSGGGPSASPVASVVAPGAVPSGPQPAMASPGPPSASPGQPTAMRQTMPWLRPAPRRRVCPDHTAGCVEGRTPAGIPPAGNPLGGLHFAS